MAKKDFTRPADAILFDMEETAAEEKPNQAKQSAQDPQKTKPKKATPSTPTADASHLKDILEGYKGGKRETACLTLKSSTKKELFKAAKKYGMSASELADIILADALASLGQ